MWRIISILTIVTSAQGQTCHEYKNHPIAKTIAESTLNMLSSELQNEINNLSADVEIEKYKTHEWLRKNRKILDYLTSYVFNETGNTDCYDTLNKRIMLYSKNLPRFYNEKPRPLDYFYDSIYRTQMWFDEKLDRLQKMYIGDKQTYALDDVETNTKKIMKSFTESTAHLSSYIENLKLIFSNYKVNSKFPANEGEGFLDDLKREILSIPFEHCERDKLYNSC